MLFIRILRFIILRNLSAKPVPRVQRIFQTRIRQISHTFHKLQCVLPYVINFVHYSNLTSLIKSCIIKIITARNIMRQHYIHAV